MIRTVPILSSESTANMTSPYQSPEMGRNLIDAVVIVTVESISGGPSVATVSPTFQIWHSVIGGNQEEVIDGGSGTSPVNSWATLAAAANPSLMPDGDWPVSINVAGATLTSPVMTTLRIDGGFPWRLNLAWALTGGTSPSMLLSAIAYLRELPAPGFDRLESGS